MITIYKSFGYTILNFSLLFSLCFLIPYLGGSFLPYIVARIASLPSTWRVVDHSLDTCPIVALLVVVEWDARCGDAIQGSFCH